MPRIPIQDRLQVVDAHLSHWQQADAENGTPIEIVTGYGAAQLQTDRDTYEAKDLEVAQLDADLTDARAQRDAIWGTSPNDEDGAWFRLTQYKNMIKARLGKRHRFARTVPNIGRATVERYLRICQQFIDHWEKVNAEVTPAVTLGTFTLAGLQTARDDLATQLTTVEQHEQTLLPLAREEREQMFGDEDEEEREETSIVARLVLYHATIEAMFPNQPLADSLPEIFPSSGGVSSPTLPTFRFNWIQEVDGSVTTWLEDPGIAEATDVFLKEGAVETTQFFDPSGPTVSSHNWPGITVIDELDALELRDDAGLTVARGEFDSTLNPPA